MTKVLIYGVNYYPEKTGIGKYTQEMAEWLVKCGYHVKVVAAPPYYPEWKVKENYHSDRYRKERINGVEIYRCPIFIPGKLSALARILHLLSFSASSLFVLFGLAFWRPQAVINIVPTILSTVGALLTARISNARKWLHIQDYEFDAAINLGILRMPRLKKLVAAAEDTIFNQFDCISTISEPMLRRILQKTSRKETAVLFPNWIDTNTIYPLTGHNVLRNQFGLCRDDIAVLYSGNMGNKQDLEIFVDVAEKLKFNQHIKILLCGEGPLKSKLVSMSAGLENLRILPLQPPERFNLLLNLADIHLLPQKPEAADIVMPSKLTGIFSSGKPVIAFTFPGTEIERVVTGCGIVVPPHNVDATTAAIVRLAENPDERKKLGQAGRAYAVRHMDQSLILNQFENRLARFIGKK